MESFRKQYEFEKRAAEQLLRSTKDERPVLYTAVYDELFKRFPDHISLIEKQRKRISKRTKWQLKLLKPYLKKDITMLEIGPGSCQLAINAAKQVREVIAVDPSKILTYQPKYPKNLRLIIAGTLSGEIPKVELVYSDNVIEHLHPKDVGNQLKVINSKLKKGGVFICVTPNKIFGPTDVSANFDKVATGLHLKEYMLIELGAMLRKAGFKFKCRYYSSYRDTFFSIPFYLAVIVEFLVRILPRKIRLRLKWHFPLSIVREVIFISWK